MYRQFALAAAVLLAVEIPALAKDRPVTDEEKTKVVAAMTAQGCAGGEIEFDDDGYFEVDDATCNDAKKYDLEFDSSFKLTKKKRDD
jgi:hypothetical protein